MIWNRGSLEETVSWFFSDRLLEILRLGWVLGFLRGLSFFVSFCLSSFWIKEAHIKKYRR